MSPMHVTLKAGVNDLLVTQNEYRPIAYWLWHDLLDILDFMAPEDQDWIDEITLEDENEKILEIIMQPKPVLSDLLVLVRFDR